MTDEKTDVLATGRSGAAPVDLDAINAGDAILSASSTPDEKTQVELDALDADAKRLDLESEQQNIEARKAYADKIFRLTSLWLLTMVVIVLLAGFGGGHHGWFMLSDSTLIALITTTTASVLGLFTIVANYLYKRR